MGKDNNFTKAVKDLLNNDRSSGTNADSSRINQTSPVSEPYYGGKSGDSTQSFGYYNPAPSRSYHEPVSGDTTFITKDTVVTGSIESKSNVQMNGQMTGDILTEKDIHITGKVDGNIDGDNIVLSDGAVIGDVTGKSDVMVDSTAVVIGNVTSDSIDADGRIKGSLKIGGNVLLKSNAVIFGNITSKSLNVQDGAVLRGNVQILSPRTEDDDLFSLSKKSRRLEEAEG